MSSLLIVDGYNVIGKWPKLIKAKHKSIELARSELFNLIQAYCDHEGSEGVIIYDGRGKKRSIEKGNPAVVYSGKGESADTVIESMVYKLTDKSKVRVVTDDRAVANMVIGMGASIISTSIFETEVNEARSSLRSFIEERERYLNRGIYL